MSSSGKEEVCSPCVLLVQPEQVIATCKSMSQWFLEVADTHERFFFPPKQNLSGSLINFCFGCSHLPVQSFPFWYLASKGIWGLFEFGLRNLELKNGLIDQNRTWFLEGQSDFYLPWSLRAEICCILRAHVQTRKAQSICQVKEQVVGRQTEKTVRKALGCERRNVRKFTSADH